MKKINFLSIFVGCGLFHSIYGMFGFVQQPPSINVNAVKSVPPKISKFKVGPQSTTSTVAKITQFNQLDQSYKKNSSTQLSQFFAEITGQRPQSSVYAPDVSKQQLQVAQIVDSPEKKFIYNLVHKSSPVDQVGYAAHEFSIIPAKNEQKNQTNNKNSDPLIENSNNQSLVVTSNKAQLQPVIATAEQLQSYLDSLSKANRLNFETMLLNNSVEQPLILFNDNGSRAIQINPNVVDAVLRLVGDLPEAQRRANLLVTNGPDVNKETSPFSKPSQSIEIAQSSSPVQPQSLRRHENSVAPVKPISQFLDQQSDVDEAVLGLVDNGSSAQGQANTSPEILDQLANKETPSFSKPLLRQKRRKPTRATLDAALLDNPIVHAESIDERASQLVNKDSKIIVGTDLLLIDTQKTNEVAGKSVVNTEEKDRLTGQDIPVPKNNKNNRVDSLSKTPSNSNVIEQIDAAPTPQAKKGILTLIKDSFLQTLGFKVKDVDPKMQSQVNVALDQAAEQVENIAQSKQTPESKKQSYLQIITNMLARIQALFAPKSA